MERVVDRETVEMKYQEEKNNCQNALPAKACFAICLLHLIFYSHNRFEEKSVTITKSKAQVPVLPAWTVPICPRELDSAPPALCGWSLKTHIGITVLDLCLAQIQSCGETKKGALGVSNLSVISLNGNNMSLFLISCRLWALIFVYLGFFLLDN